VYAEARVDDEYAILQKDASVNVWARSCNIYVSKDSDIDISFQHSLKSAMASTKLDAVAVIQLYGSDGTYYTMDDDGIFYQSNSTWTTNVKLIQVTYASGEGEDWYDKEMSGSIPKDGYINIMLLKDTTSPKDYIYFRGLDIIIDAKVQKFRRLKIKGDYDRYTIDRNITKNYEEQIYLDDAQLQIHKGAILEDDGITLTTDQWFRRKDFNGDVSTDERLTFKRQHALAKWYMNKGYKTKLDVNLYGLKWKDTSDVEYPIGLINTIKFVDDAPNKIFAIANLSEIDFMSCTWRATLYEIFDTDVADNEPGATDVHTFDYYYE
jgi:hypothetical protein